MSTQNDKLDFSQPEGDKNQMSFYAEQQRSKLFPRNDFNTKNQYGPTNKDALSDGDAMGRGTGGSKKAAEQSAAEAAAKVILIN